MAIDWSFGIQDFLVGVLRDFRINPLTEQEKELAIQKVIDDANKKYGKGALVRGADARGLKINRLKTGSISLDVATGGGWAWGKLNEVFGPYCLDGDSVVNYHLPHWEKKRGKDRVRPITISELFKVNLKNEEIYIESVDEATNEVILNRVISVYNSGIKGLCRITTKHGFTLKSTTEHLYLTTNGYERLGDLQVGDSIAVVDRRNSFNKKKDRQKWDTIVSIEYVEDKVTYDISMVAPNNNFIANGIVVHNSGGKSYVSQLTMAQTQKDYPNANVALIDFEGAFDSDWARKIGVDVDSLLISSPEYMEDGLQIAVDLIHSQDCALIVVDSLAAACPKAEYDGDITEFTVGLRARLGNKFVRKSKGKVDLTSDELDLGQTTILVVNQTYKNIGGYGDPDVTPGGEQVKFGAMIRVKIRKGEVVNDSKDGTQIMQESRFTVVKNKTYPPHKAGAFWFSTQDNPKGKAGEIYRTGEIITYGILTGVISRSGAWYALPGEFGLEKSLQGEAAVAEWVVDNLDKYPRLEELVMQAILKGNTNED